LLFRHRRISFFADAKRLILALYTLLAIKCEKIKNRISIVLYREEIIGHALALLRGDREIVAVALQDSLECRTESRDLVRNEFYEELRRRSAAYRAGQSLARPAAEVMAELYQKQLNEPSQ
jgi:hypothetical protein